MGPLLPRAGTLSFSSRANEKEPGFPRLFFSSGTTAGGAAIGCGVDGVSTSKRVNTMERKKIRACLLLAGLMSACAAGAASAGDVALSPAQRGALAGSFVRKWGAYVERVHAVPVADWAMRMVPTFVHAEPERIRHALVASTFDAALADLDRGLSRPSGGAKPAKVLGAAGSDLVYTPLAPCRIVDTRVAGGPIAAGQSRAFNASAAAGGGYAAQGGSAGDCGSLTSNLAGAVVLNVTTVGPSIAGYATVYPYGDVRPATASVNYGAGGIVNNTVVTRIPSPPQNKDFNLYSLATSDYVIDIVGYYAAPVATELSCVATKSPLVVDPALSFRIFPGACPAGYSFVAGSCRTENIVADRIDWTITGMYMEDATSRMRPACTGINRSDTTVTVTAIVQCCRVPGR